MFSQKAIERVNLIAKKIDFINAIVSEKGSVSNALKMSKTHELPY